MKQTGRRAPASPNHAAAPPSPRRWRVRPAVLLFALGSLGATCESDCDPDPPPPTDGGTGGAGAAGASGAPGDASAGASGAAGAGAAGASGDASAGASGAGGGAGAAGGGGAGAAGGQGGGAGVAGSAGTSGVSGSGGASGSGGEAGAAGSAGASGGAGAAGASGASGAGGQGGEPGGCGDGERDPEVEECDDGNASADDLCSPACQVLDRLARPAAPAPPDGGLVPAGRTLGRGRHPVAASASGFAVAWVEQEAPGVEVWLGGWDALGVPGAPARVSGGVTVPLGADPGVAALSGGRYAVVFDTLGAQGGDGADVALRVVTPGAAATSALSFVHDAVDFGQRGAELLALPWSGSGPERLLAAWVDEAALGTAPDVRARVLEVSGEAVSGGASFALGATIGGETSPALATLGGGWAAAWRRATGGEEWLHARTEAGTEWTIGPVLSGAAEDRPALAALDAAHLLLVFTEGQPPGEAGAPRARLRGAILALAAPGATPFFSLSPADAGEPESAWESSPALAISGSSVYVAFRSGTELPGERGEELRLLPALWDEALATLYPGGPFGLPREEAHGLGDQRWPALAAGGAAQAPWLAAAWEDHGRTFGAGEGGPDVVVELLPLPIVRLGSGGGES